MSEEEKKAIEFINNIEYKEITNNEFYDCRDILLNLIEKQQKIINQLLEDVKERANNISFETEILWRKIEKAEKEFKEE